MSIKELKREYIAGIATKLFLSRSISEITIKDIAEAAEVGEATVYRHFGSKRGTVIAAATLLQKRVYKNFYTLEGGNGFLKISRFYEGYRTIFVEHREYCKFINEFDVFMQTDGSGDLGEYSDGLDLFKSEFLAAYQEGVADGSVRDVGDIEAFYYATTHALLGLCKKLSSGKIVRQDESVSKERELSALIEVILSYLKK